MNEHRKSLLEEIEILRAGLDAFYDDLDDMRRAYEAERVHSARLGASIRMLREAREEAQAERDEAYALVYGGFPPTFPDRLNSLPAWARAYIGSIETNADPAGTLRSVAVLRENCAGLQLLLAEERASAALQPTQASSGGTKP